MPCQLLPRRRSRAALLLAALAFTLAVAPCGCSKRHSSMSILKTVPEAGSTGVSPDTQVAVTFSAPVREDTLSLDTFSVRGKSSGITGGQIVYDNSSRVATFKPAGPFAPGEEVTVAISSSIRGQSGAGLRGRTFSFTIRPASDPEPPPPPPPPPPTPLVTGRSPAPYAAAPVNAVVVITFSERMDLLTLTSDTVRLSGSLAGRRGALLGFSADGRQLSLSPHRPFLPGEWITVSLRPGIRSQAGVPLAWEVFSFRAAAGAPQGPRLPGPTLDAGDPLGLLEMADLDGDDRPDVVHGVAGEARVRIARGVGEGRFEPSGELDAGRPVLSLHVADLEENGFLDVLLGAVDRVVVFRGKAPAGSFHEGEVFPTGAAVRGIASGNLDGQGGLDLLLDTDRGIRLYLDELAGTPALTIGDVRAARTSLVVRDLDLDGVLDLVYGDSSGDRLAVHHGRRGGTLEASPPVPLGGDALWVEVDDLGGDAGPEILVHSASMAGSLLHVLAAGPGPPGAGAALEPQAGERIFHLADLDGEAAGDLLSLEPEAGLVRLHPNQGGSFDLDSAVELARNLPARDAAAVDITGDGVLDLVLLSGNELRTLLSEGGEEPPPPPPPPSARMVMDSLGARPGESRTAMVRLTTDATVEAFTVALRFDPRAVAAPEVTLEGTATLALAPEFVSPLVGAAEGFASLAVAFDLLPPFDARTLPPVTEVPLAGLRFTVPLDAPAGSYPLELRDTPGDPSVQNAVVHAGLSVAALVQHGTLQVEAVPPPPDPNLLSIESVEVVAGTPGVRTGMRLTTAQPVDAYSVVAAYDPAATRVVGFDISGTVTGAVAPEFVVPAVREAEGFFAYSVIFDFSPPFEAKQILPGEDLLLVKVVFDVPAAALPGEHAISLRNDLGNPPLANTLVGASQSYFPELESGVVTVLAAPPPPPDPTFTRGNVNGMRGIDIADFIYLVDYLFVLGPPPPCLDAADVDDSGRVTFGDGVALLDYLFKGSPLPAVPFPGGGEDPSDDDLSCLGP